MIILLSAAEFNDSSPMARKTFIFLFIFSLLLQGISLPEESDSQSSSNPEADYVARIQSLEASLYAHTQNATLEKELAQAYLDYSKFLINQDRQKEARDFLDMAKTLGVEQSKTALLESEMEKKPIPAGADAKKEERLPEAILPQGTNPDAFFMGKAIVYQLFKEGVEAYKDKNYSLAEEQMKRVLEYDPQNKYAHELLGDISYQTQNLEKAKYHWERAMTSQNMNRVRSKLSKLEKEIPVETQLKSANEEHFLIRYDRTQKEYSSYQLKSMLREAYKVIYRDLGVPLSGKIVVLLYDQEVFDRAVKPRHWSGALFDGKIRIPLAKGDENKPATSRFLKKLIRHELSHVFVYEIGGKNVPLWMQEGIAQYEENRVSRILIDNFHDAFARGKIFSITDLERGERLFKDDKSVLTFYQESFLYITFMNKRYGFYKVREILKAIGKGETFDSAMVLVLNISPEDLDQQFHSWVKTDL